MENTAVAKITDHPDFETSLVEDATLNQLPEFPDYLTPLAKKHWPELVESLGRHKIINELDKDVLGIYCSMVARFIELDIKLDDVGITQKSPKGYEAETATFTAWKSLLKQILSYAKQLGLTPPARVALQANNNPQQTDLLDL